MSEKHCSPAKFGVKVMSRKTNGSSHLCGDPICGLQNRIIIVGTSRIVRRGIGSLLVFREASSSASLESLSLWATLVPGFVEYPMSTEERELTSVALGVSEICREVCSVAVGKPTQ